MLVLLLLLLLLPLVPAFAHLGRHGRLDAIDERRVLPELLLPMRPPSAAPTAPQSRRCSKTHQEALLVGLVLVLAAHAAARLLLQEHVRVPLVEAPVVAAGRA